MADLTFPRANGAQRPFRPWEMKGLGDDQLSFGIYLE